MMLYEVQPMSSRSFFVDTPEVVHKSLSLIVGHSKRDVLDKPGSFSAHLVNCDAQQSRTWAKSSSAGFSMSNAPRSLAPVSPGATDFRDYPGRVSGLY